MNELLRYSILSYANLSYANSKCFQTSASCRNGRGTRGIDTVDETEARKCCHCLSHTNILRQGHRMVKRKAVERVVEQPISFQHPTRDLSADSLRTLAVRYQNYLTQEKMRHQLTNNVSCSTLCLIRILIIFWPELGIGSKQDVARPSSAPK